MTGKSKKTMAEEPLPADEVVVNPAGGPSELPLGDEKCSGCDVDKAFVENLVNEAKALMEEVHEELSKRIADLEKEERPTSECADGLEELEERMTALETRLHVAPKPGRETHTVVEGDSLAKIAKAYFGNAGRFPEIVTLNQIRYPSLATNPIDLEEGWVLELP